MKSKFQFYIIYVVFQLCFSFTAQSQILIKGIIAEETNKNPIPFASVSLKQKLIGTTANENGRFDFYIPEDAKNDTLIINYLGYTSALIPIKTIKEFQIIYLKPSVFQIKEIVVTPISPTDYIRFAMRMAKFNYPDKPFETEAYYRNRMLENNEIINLDEGIFKSYYANYQDTTDKQHQLLLYQQADKKQLQFMKAKRDKKKEKFIEKNQKLKEKGKLDTAKKGSNGTGVVEFANMMGGPENLLNLDVIKSKEDFLDTNKFKNFKYEFDEPSSYQGRELIVIKFKSKGTSDHVRYVGKIYIDFETYAIVNLEYDGDFVIPILLKPVIFMLGYGIENPTVYQNVNYQFINGRWYPKNLQYNIAMKIERKYVFKTNEVANIYMEGIFAVNKIKFENVTNIPKTKQYDKKKKMKDQVYNDQGISWNGMNMIKK